MFFTVAMKKRYFRYRVLLNIATLSICYATKFLDVRIVRKVCSKRKMLLLKNVNAEWSVEYASKQLFPLRMQQHKEGKNLQKLFPCIYGKTAVRTCYFVRLIKAKIINQ